MANENHQTFVYVGLGGENPLLVGAEGPSLDQGGIYRRGDGEDEWTIVTNGLPATPQVRSLMVHPEDSQVIFRRHPEGRVPNRRPGRSLGKARLSRRGRLVFGRPPQ